MNHLFVALKGDIATNLYHLGQKEKEAFLQIEDRIKKLQGTHPLVKWGADLFTTVKVYLKKRQESLFESAITSYCEGLGVDSLRFHALLYLMDPGRPKRISPGGLSVLAKREEEITHTHLLDFPLVGLFDRYARAYYWKTEDRPALLSFSCEGLAPVFFLGLHESGFSFSLHQKPNSLSYEEGDHIFKIIFESVFESSGLGDFKKNLKKKNSLSKWSVVSVDKSGQTLEMELDGPSQRMRSYDLNENSPLVFTNLPLQEDSPKIPSLRLFEDREEYAREKLSSPKAQDPSVHWTDLLTQLERSKERTWLHPCATLSTVGVWEINLTKGVVDLKTGEAPMTSSNSIVRLNLSHEGEINLLKKASSLTTLELAWKRAATAQMLFDEGKADLGFHELQMSQVQMNQAVWKNILKFYQCVWEFKFISDTQELSLVYKTLKGLKLPELLKSEWIFMCMRFEKKLNLSSTVSPSELSPFDQELFYAEKGATKTVFATWMNLLYPRMENLEIISLPLKKN